MNDETADTDTPSTGLLRQPFSIEDAVKEQIGTEEPATETPDDDAQNEAISEDNLEADPLEALDDDAETDDEEPDDGTAEVAPLEIDLEANYSIGDGTQTGKDLIEGNLRQADYSRKTQKASERLQAADSLFAEAARNAEKYGHVQVLQMQQHANVIGQPPDQAAYGDNQTAYFKAKDLYRDQVDNQNRLQGEYQETQAFIAQEHELQKQQIQKRSEEQIALNIPEWSDPKIAAADHADIQEYLSDMGYSQHDVDNIIDHRAIEIARDGVIGRRFRLGKEQLRSKRKPKVGASMRKTGERGAAPKPRSIKEAQQRLNASGSIEDAVALQLVSFPKG